MRTVEIYFHHVPSFTFGFPPKKKRGEPPQCKCKTLLCSFLKCWWYKTVLASPVFQNERCFSASSFVRPNRPVRLFISCSCDLIHTNINAGNLSLAEKLFHIQGWRCTRPNSTWRLSARKKKLPLPHTGCPSHSVCWTGPLVSQTENAGLRIRTCTASHLPINRRQPAALHKQAYWINVKKHSGPAAR